MDRNQVYKCNVCGNEITVSYVGGGSLVCCGHEMNLMEENATDGAIEKHVPVIEKTEAGIIVKVGEAEHPMNTDHYIEWIEIIFDNRVGRVYLKPGDKPQAEFNIQRDGIKARAYCNLHGLWVSAA